MSNIYFVIYVALALLGLGMTLARHGESRIDKYNFWSSLVVNAGLIALIYFAVRQGF